MPTAGPKMTPRVRRGRKPDLASRSPGQLKTMRRDLAAGMSYERFAVRYKCSVQQGRGLRAWFEKEDREGPQTPMPAAQVPPEPARIQATDGMSAKTAALADYQWARDRHAWAVAQQLPEDTIIKLMHQVNARLKILAKFQGEIEITPRMVALSPSFQRMWTEVLDVLREHPAALKAINGRLREMTEGALG